MRKIAIILNGISLKKKFFYSKILPHLSKQFEVDVLETRTKHDAVALASKAVNKYSCDVLIAAGGDGTLNQVLNGMFRGREHDTKLPLLGVLPIGSGNDFARTLKVTTDVNVLIDKLTSLKYCTLDVGKIEYQSKEEKNEISYFI